MPLPTLIPTHWALHRNSTSVHLAPQEHKVYTFLLDNPSTTISGIARGILASKGTVWTVVKRLRAKLQLVGLTIRCVNRSYSIRDFNQ